MEIDITYLYIFVILPLFFYDLFVMDVAVVNDEKEKISINLNIEYVGNQANNVAYILRTSENIKK